MTAPFLVQRHGAHGTIWGLHPVAQDSLDLVAEYHARSAVSFGSEGRAEHGVERPTWG